MLLRFLAPKWSLQEVFVFETGLCPVTQAGVQSQLTAASTSWARDPPTSASHVAGTTGTQHYTWPIFVEVGFHRITQAGLNLLGSRSSCLGLPKCSSTPSPTTFLIITLNVPLTWGSVPGTSESQRLQPCAAANCSKFCWILP
uniref:Unnamed protein product n=1 Tax=Macaca fascicularis TaxID=9541 RepID=Q9N0B9_MACFA|nr:unnamed protein product [Macaca fascicularis]